MDAVAPSSVDAVVVGARCAGAATAMLLKRLDDFSSDAQLDVRLKADTTTHRQVGDPEPFEPVWPSFLDAPVEMNLGADGITSVVWATGYRRVYPWLRLPVLDRRGDIAHDGGVTASPGVYVLGMQFQRRRNSNFIDGVGKDARYLAVEIAAHLGHTERAIA